MAKYIPPISGGAAPPHIEGDAVPSDLLEGKTATVLTGRPGMKTSTVITGTMPNLSNTITIFDGNIYGKMVIPDGRHTGSEIIAPIRRDYLNVEQGINSIDFYYVTQGLSGVKMLIIRNTSGSIAHALIDYQSTPGFPTVVYQSSFFRNVFLEEPYAGALRVTIDWTRTQSAGMEILIMFNQSNLNVPKG